MPSKETILTHVKQVILTLFAAVIGSVGMHVFVYPADFAPMGVDGIATMLQKVTGINAGYFSVMINLPLLIVAWFVLKKSYVIYTLLLTFVSSGLLILLREIEFYQFSMENELLIAVICGGILIGARTGIMLAIRASSGGIDIIAAMCQKKLPHVKIESIIGLICNIITILSYFVYRNFLCIILSIILNFVFEAVVDHILRGNRKAVEIKIITDEPDAIVTEIIQNFKHGGYTIEGKGIFSGVEKTIISSVINTRQIPDFMRLCRQHPGSFAYHAEVDGVNGNFRWYRDDEVK